MSSDFLRAVGEAAVKAAVDAAIQYAIGELTRTDPKRPDSFVTIKQTVPVRHFAYGRGRKPGAFAYWESANGHTLDVIAFCHGRIGGNWDFWFHDDPVEVGGDGVTAQGENGRYGGPIRVFHREGLPTETAYSQVTAISAAWTSAHRGDHTASAAVLCKMVSSEKMGRIYPNGQVETSAAADWLCVYDWRDEAQDREDPATWQWSDNPIVCWVHDEWARNAAYWDHPSRGALERTLANRVWSRRFQPTLDILTAEADACDEMVEGAKRYTAFVWYMADTDRKSVREMFRRSCDGWMVERGDGAYIFRCGRWLVNPTPIDDAMLVELPLLRAGIAKSELINDLQIRFTSWDHNHEVVDTDPWTDEASIAKRGRKTEVLELPEVNVNGQARRVGKSAFYALNALYRGSLTIDLDRAPDNLFDYRFQRLQTVEGSSAFRDMTVEFGRPEINLLERTITVDFRSADPDRYAWGEAEEGAGPGSDVRPGVGDIPVPTLAGSPVYAGGSIRFQIDGPLPYESLTPVVRWWPTDTPTSVSLEDLVPVAGPGDDAYVYTAVITGIGPGLEVLTAEIGYRNAAGVLGVFTTAALVDLPPPSFVEPPSDLIATVENGVVTFGWRNPISDVFDFVNVYRGTTSTFGAATLIDWRAGAAGASLNVPDEPGADLDVYYWAAAVDIYGSVSAPEALSSPVFVSQRAGANLITAPSDFGNAAWVGDNSSGTNPVVTTNTGVGPDGTTTADQIVFSRGSGFSRLSQSVTVANGISHEFGVWLRASTPGASIALRLDNTETATLTLTTDWKYFSITQVSTSTTTFAQLILWASISGSPSTCTVEAASASLTAA